MCWPGFNHASTLSHSGWTNPWPASKVDKMRDKVYLNYMTYDLLFLFKFGVYHWIYPWNSQFDHIRNILNTNILYMGPKKKYPSFRGLCWVPSPLNILCETQEQPRLAEKPDDNDVRYYLIYLNQLKQSFDSNPTTHKRATIHLAAMKDTFLLFLRCLFTRR